MGWCDFAFDLVKCDDQWKHTREDEGVDLVKVNILVDLVDHYYTYLLKKLIEEK